MEIREIIKDSLRYPFSDWKKFLILGIIFLITEIEYISMNFGKNEDLLVLLIGITFVVSFLINGYIIRIIKSSLDGKVELPEFNNWVDMGVKGAKVYIVYIVYVIPAICFIIFFSGFLINSGISVFEFLPAFNSVLWQGIGNFIGLFDLFGTVFIIHNQPTGILFIGILYLIIITPILLVAISNMVYDGKFSSAFKFRDVLEEITDIGWVNLTKWYITTGIIFIIFMIISFIVFYISNSINNHILGEIINALIIYPYISIFLARSLALFYRPDEED